MHFVMSLQQQHQQHNHQQQQQLSTIKIVLRQSVSDLLAIELLRTTFLEIEKDIFCRKQVRVVTPTFLKQNKKVYTVDKVMRSNPS